MHICNRGVVPLNLWAVTKDLLLRGLHLLSVLKFRGQHTHKERNVF